MPATYLDNRKIRNWLLDGRAAKRVKRDGRVVFESGAVAGPYVFRPYYLVYGGLLQAYFDSRPAYGGPYGSVTPNPVAVPGGFVVSVGTTWTVDISSWQISTNVIVFDRPNIGRGLKSVTINGVVHSLATYVYDEIQADDGIWSYFWRSENLNTPKLFVDGGIYNVAFNF